MNELLRSHMLDAARKVKKDLGGSSLLPVEDDVSQADDPEKSLTSIDEAVQKIQTRQTQENVYGAVRENPDAYAKDKETADRMKLPVDVIRHDKENSEAQIKTEDVMSAIENSPTLKKFMTDPDSARLAHDDVRELGAIELLMEFSASPIERDLVEHGGAALKRGGIRVQSLPHQLAAEEYREETLDADRSFLDILRDESFKSTPSLKFALPSPLDLVMAGERYITSRIGDKKETGDAAKAHLMKVGKLGKKISEIPMSDSAAEAMEEIKVGGKEGLIGAVTAAVMNPFGTLALGAEVGLEFAPQIGASVGVTTLTRNPMAGATTMGLMSGLTERYASPAEFLAEHGYDVSKPEDAIKALIDPSVMIEAQRYGLNRGMIIGMFDFASGGAASKTLMEGPVKEFLAQMGIQMGLGGGGEAAAQFYTKGKNIDWAEVVLEAVGELATGPIEIIGVGGRLIDDQQKKNKNDINKLNKVLEASKLRERNKPKFKEYMEELGKKYGTDTVFLDAEGVNLLFQSGAVAEEVLESPVIQKIMEDIPAAMADGRLIEVPLGDYATDIVGSEIQDSLSDHMKLKADDLTPNEEKTRAEEKETKADGPEFTQQEIEYADVRDDMVVKLREIGRSATAEADATLFAKVLERQAEREGKSVAQLYKEKPFTPRNAMPGEVPGEKMLDQDEGDAAPEILKQGLSVPANTARKNNIGLYSMVEKAVEEMRIPAWKPKKGDSVFTPEMDAQFEEVSGQLEKMWADLGNKYPGEDFKDTTEGKDILDGPLSKIYNDLKAKKQKQEDRKFPLVSGKEIWAKFKKGIPGVKQEELKWMGLEEYLTMGGQRESSLGYKIGTEDDIVTKFTRQDVINFIQNNGVVVDEIQAADEEEEGRGYEELRWGSHEIDDDSENWAGRVEDDLYNFDNGENEGVSMRSINDWMDTWVRENIDKVIDNYKPSLDTETMTEIGMMRDSYTEEIDDPQKVLDILHSSGYDVADDMRQEARSDFEEAAEEAAEQEYMNDPYIRIEDEGGSGLLIYGNDDLGYDVRTGRTYSEVVIEAVSSINEAQIQAQIYAEENDLLDYEGSNEDEESVAKWSGYEMEGDHDNYREIKLRLPQLNTSYYDDHFPDRNLFAFLRVDDRDLDTGVEATPAPESFEIEHKIIPPSGIITTREFVVTRKDTGEVLYSRMIPESYTDEQIKKQTDRLSKVGEGVIPGHQVHSEGRLIPASKNKGGSSTYFIDEFQSGYHQKGNKVGYVTQDEKFTTEEIKDQFHSADDKFIRSRPIGIGEKLEKIKERMLAVEAFRPSTGDTFASLFYEFANWKAHSSQILGAKVNRQIKAIKKDVREIYNQSVEGAELLRLTGERIRLEANLPIAPFKDDAWITLGLKRAIVDAAEQGYEAIAWPDSEVLVSRWHKEYRSAYQEQYDKKMPSIVKKLTGQKPKHFDLLGNVMEDKPKNPDNLPEGYDVRQGGSSDFELSIGEGKAVKEGWRGVRLPESRDEGEDYVEVTSSVYETKEEALDWVFEHEDMYATSGTQGYHIIEITDELREKITADGFPLFQSGDGPRGYFDPGTGEATFTNNSDLSTFLHEASHYFFILLQESAQSSDEVAKDIGTLEKWFLDNGADSYVMRQEMFASGMETYMMEGKAPIPELRPLFAKFKSWLLFVYESLRKSNPFAANDLGGVQLSDEVRNVFDRMLASQEAIDQARADNSYDAMPVNEMGLDLKTIAQYHDLGEQAKAEADNELTKELLGEISREKKKWWKAGVKEYAAQVEKEINERKEYVARDYLSGKRIPEGGEAVKLNAEYLTEFYDSDSRKKLKKMSSKDGANPEQLARYFGYASGDEMIQALLGTMNEKDRKASIMAEAEARMLDEHGSTMHDFGKKENKAQETVHNEKQAELLARELQILNKKIGKDFATKGTPKDVRGIYKAQAEEDVTRVSVGRLKPNLHLANERKHGGESYRFAAQGKFVEARDAKHKQIRQFYMYREALKVKEQAEKNVVRLKGWQKKKFNPKTVNPDFIKHVKELLEGYHFGNKIGEERKARLSSETLEAWAEQQEKKYGASFHISAELDRALTKENYNDLTSGEIQGLHDTVKSVLSQGRKYSDAEKLQFNSLMARITNGVDNNATQQLRVPKERSLLDDIGRLGRLIMAEHRTVESLSLEMDGEEFGGEVMTEVYLRLKRADDNYIDRGMKAGRELNDIFNMYSPKEKLKFYNKTYIRELGESLSLSARLSFALNMGNAGNVDAMMNEYSGEEVEAVLSTLTDKDWDVVEAIWTNIDQYWNDTKDASGRVIAYGISTIEEKTTGVKPEKVEAVPFITPSGRKVRGGYYPLVADPRRSEAGKKDWDQSQTLDGFLSKGRAKASTKHGSTIERVGFGSNRFVWLDLGVVFGHVDGVIKDIEMREAVAETNRIVTDERFRNSVMRAKGEEFHDVFEEWVKSTVGSIEQPLDFWDNVAHWARAGVSLAEMGLSPRTMLQQPFGLTQTVAIIGEKYTAIGVAKFMAGRGDAARAAFELSAFLRNRASTFNRDVRDAHNSLGVKGLHEDIVTAAFWGIQKLDMAVSVPTWLGAYEKAMDDGLTGQLAVDFADSVVIRGQGGGLPRNLSKVQNRKGLIRALTMFYSFFGAYYNLQTNMWKGTSFKNPKQALKYARNQVWVTIIPALLIDYLFNGGPEEDEDEWIWALKTQLGYLAGGLIGLRDIANSATTGFDYQITPAGNVFAAPLDFYEQVKQGDLDAALVKSGTMTASYVFHVPGGRAVARASDVIMDEGTSELDSFEGWWRLLVQGKKR